jgi:hypothetical protein
MAALNLSPAFGGAVFIVVAMSLAGFAHVFWLKSRASKYFSHALDGGMTVRGRRLFGANKMLRGLMMMPLASALTFAVFGALRNQLPDWLAAGTWELGTGEYARLGTACGLAFMLAELPNSFLKRQLDVRPGEPPRQPWFRPVCFLLDRVDSTLGVMLVLSFTMRASATMWLWVFLLGPVSHAFFSTLLHRFGEKARAL